MGPILILGAGGFIGFNLLLELLKKRSDVFGVSHDPEKNWRFNTGRVSKKNIVKCDISDDQQLKKLLLKLKPKTIFNLAAFGAYSHQQDPKKIYETNFTATLNSVEYAKEFGFDAYVYAGTSSEYGLNCKAPKENEMLLPNSHYAVSKAAVSHLISYYRKIEDLPVAHLRLYSAYGPWEEPKRLIPQLVLYTEKKAFPPLVNPNISRDYVYVGDIINAIITTALQIKKLRGSVYNVATGEKTTIQDLSMIIKKLKMIQVNPVFSTMSNRRWDLINWYGDPKMFNKEMKWKCVVSLEQGLKNTIKWHDKNHLWHL